MATHQLTQVLQSLREAALPPQEAGLTDGQLLDSYLRTRQESALVDGGQEGADEERDEEGAEEERPVAKDAAEAQSPHAASNLDLVSRVAKGGAATIACLAQAWSSGGLRSSN